MKMKTEIKVRQTIIRIKMSFIIYIFKVNNNLEKAFFQSQTKIYNKMLTRNKFKNKKVFIFIIHAK